MTPEEFEARCKVISGRLNVYDHIGRATDTVIDLQRIDVVNKADKAIYVRIHLEPERVNLN